VLDWGVRARVAIARGRTEEALSALRHVSDGHSLSAWARLRAGQLDLRRHCLRAAEAELRGATDLDPGLVEARRELIYILGVQLRRRELAAAFEGLAARAPLTPREVWVWCMVPDLVWWAPQEHEPMLRQALAADPGDRWSRLALAEDARRQGRHAEADALLAPLPGSDPDARAARARSAIDRGDLDSATTLLSDGPDDHPCLASLRGRTALARGDSEAAVCHLRRALAAEPGRRQHLADLGRALTLAGLPDEAAPLLAAAARVDELDNLLLKAEREPDGIGPDLCRRLGAACEAAGRRPEARTWYATLAARDPLDAEAQRALFRLSDAQR
jgi:predicted Zn-dependent protease